MLYVFSKKFPNLGMIIIMALRFIPLIKKRSQELSRLSKLKNRNNKPSLQEKAEETAHNLGSVVSWSLEESMMTASSMKARGYNITKRTSYLNYNFNKTDKILAIVIAVCTILSIIGYVNGIGHINIYPVFTFKFSQIPLNIYYLAYIVLFLPFIIIEIRERILWHS
jgi:energy-coupling factor transport system permease protein